MHWIQYHILDQLINNKTRRFSELRAEGVESNLFQWHLKQVMKLGYVEKLPNGAGYQLSPKGLYFADRLSTELKTERIQPKIITIVALRNGAGEFLLHTEYRQPYIDTARFPAGKVHNDESLLYAATRETEEKLHIKVENLSPAGAVHVRIRLNDELTSEYYGFIFTGQYDGAVPDKALWYSPDQSPDPTLMPSVREIIDYVLAGDHEMREYEIAANE
jgi:8-oxo-dGTP pyrophosphatase MutT (NUDIX family)